MWNFASICSIGILYRTRVRAVAAIGRRRSGPPQQPRIVVFQDIGIGWAVLERRCWRGRKLDDLAGRSPAIPNIPAIRPKFSLLGRHVGVRRA
jgi:hypothetical protein